MNPVLVINGLPHHSKASIVLQTSKYNNIENEQYFGALQQEVENERRNENQFQSKYFGELSAIYNCHGLVFASKRTGIYEPDEIYKILADEYREIKNIKDVNPGDVVLYFGDGNILLHSAVVTQKSDFGLIKVLSKTRRYKEIEHIYSYSPYNAIEYKFYRINHGATEII